MIVEPERSPVEGKTSIGPRVVLSVVILFTVRILGPLRFETLVLEVSRHSPWSLFFVYDPVFYEYRE